MLAGGQNLWAVAVPVQLRYEGDLAPGRITDENATREEGLSLDIRGSNSGPNEDPAQVPGVGVPQGSVVQSGVLQAPQGFSQSPQRSR